MKTTSAQSLPFAAARPSRRSTSHQFSRSSVGWMFALALVISFAGCRTSPVTVTKLAPQKAQENTAISGPVFFLPNVEFVITVPLDAYEAPVPGSKPALVLYASADSKRLITVQTVAVAEKRYPLVAHDSSGAFLDVSQYELSLDENSVLTKFNRTEEDKTLDTAVSLVKLTLSGLAMAATVDESKFKGPLPAQISFRVRPGDIQTSSEDIASLVSRIEVGFDRLFWLQNSSFLQSSFSRLLGPVTTVSRSVHSPFHGATAENELISNSARIGEILDGGVPGIPYRIPADHFLTFTSTLFGRGSQTLVLRAKSPDGQPLLVAPIRGRRFTKSVSSVEIDTTGALTKYSSTSTSAAANVASTGANIVDAIKADKKAREDAEAKEKKESFGLAIKLRTLLEQKQAKQDEIAAVESMLVATPGDQKLIGELRTRQSELDVINLKIEANLAGVDL